MFELGVNFRVRQKRVSPRMFSVLVLAGTLGACSMFDRDATISYESSVHPQVLIGAERVAVSITSEEGRPLYESQRVGQYGNENMLMDIRTGTNIPKAIENAVRSELRIMGYRVDQLGKRLNIRLEKFHADPRRTKRSFYGTFAEGRVTVEVFDQYGRLMIERHLKSQSRTEGADYDSSTVSESLGAVLSDLVKKIVMDPDVRRILFY